MVKQSTRQGQTTSDGVPVVTPWLFRWFLWYCQTYYLPGAFDAIRLSGPQPPKDRPGPYIVALNHPSWWDPLLAFFASRFFSDFQSFAPMEEKAVAKYRFFQRLGIFGVDSQSMAGARRFLSIGRKILETETNALWVTVQGQFTDPRVRPVETRPGVAHLLSGMNRGTLWTLAMEFPFWEEPYPQALFRFGEPINIEPGIPPKAWNLIVARRLTQTMDDLAADACSRDPEKFSTLLVGKSRVGGMFDRLRRMGSFFTGKRFDPRHRLGGKTIPKSPDAK